MINIINRRSLIQQAHEMALHNLHCYSKDHLNKEPKADCLQEWKDAKRSAMIWQQMLDELGSYAPISDSLEKYHIFVGSIGSTSTTKNIENQPIIDTVEVDISHNSYDYEDRRIFHCGWECQSFLLDDYDIERHSRYDEGKGHTVRLYVDNINYIRKIEWVDDPEQ